ncbi:MAG: hypothetical protein U9R15_06165 [Chloroflexota bacterium]|nr:hypothetical protein [Chloroflexota bacterium]
MRAIGMAVSKRLRAIGMAVSKRLRAIRMAVLRVYCTVEGHSRSQVIQRVRQALIALLSEAELVRIEIESPHPRSALAQFAGMWVEDDTFDEFVAAMELHRQGVNRDERQL